MRLKFILALAAGIAACSPALADDDQGNMPIIKSDERTVEVRGVYSRAGTTEWFLRSFVDKRTHVVVQHQLYVDTAYTAYSWLILDTARTGDGEPLPVRSVKRSSGACPLTCRYSETLVVEIPEALLRDRAQTGFEVKISARVEYTYLDLSVTPEMIRKQLTVLAEAEKMP